MQDIVENDLSDFIVKGTYITGQNVWMISFVTHKGSSNIVGSFFRFTKKGILLSFYYTYSFNGDPNSSIIFVAKDTKLFEDDEDNIYTQIKLIMVYSMFKSYAQVETKVLQGNSKSKDVNCKYVNDTKSVVTFLDSKWFTTLVKSDGFNVRGHFRLQPKKVDNVWTKELIWISEFKKTGYTAPAKKLSFINNTN